MNALYSIGEVLGYVDMTPPACIIPNGWCLLKVRPHSEMSIVERLRDRGIACHVATELWSRATGWGRRRMVTLPIFGEIIFVADYDADLPRLRGLVDGVRGFVRLHNGNQAWADRKVWAEILALEARLALPLGKRRLQLKQRVRIVDGPFCWFEGPIENLDSHGRLKVLLEVLGRQVPVEFDETQLEAV